MTKLPVTDINFLYNWNKSVLKFMNELVNHHDHPLTAADKETIRSISETLECLKSKQNLRGMRTVFNDLREWAGCLTVADQQELAKILEAEVGSGTARFKKPR